MPSPILSDPTVFRDTLLSETVSTSTDAAYGAVLRVLLYYIWRGCALARSAGLSRKGQANCALIALSSYKALLPILQLIRLGYHAEALVLIRALMERIALVGYLGDNRELIPKYLKGKIAPYREALAWAKRKPLQNWMLLYGVLSNVAHSHVEGVAGDIFDATTIGEAFREIPLAKPKPRPDMTAELLGFAVYALMALDPLGLSLIGEVAAQPIPNDPSMISIVGLSHAMDFKRFLESLVQRHRAGNHSGNA